MGIQDLGAVGEFISSLVIVVTLLVLIYEVRGIKQATLQSNAQERQRKQEGCLTTMSETPSLMASLFLLSCRMIARHLTAGG